ncbi:MAG: alpha/beta fold hydrolase [Acidimicrobiales bacterium]|jgi:3-oxoadipate enol-lactonase
MITRDHVIDWAATWRSFAGIDVEGRPADCDPPTLVLAGELDASTTPEVMSGIAKRIAGARYQQLPGAPHLMSLEQPRLVTDALDAFLPSGSHLPKAT